MIIRKTFPQIYQLDHSTTGKTYYMVSARSVKWGMNERKSFDTEQEARNYANEIEKRIKKNGAQSNISKEVVAKAESYSKLVECLSPYGKSPEDATTHYIKYLGEEVIRQVKPTVGQLVEQFQVHKLLEKVDTQYENEIKVHCRFIRITWGERKIDDLRKNEIEKTLIKRHSNKNTRRKYLTFVRMFFNWVLGEDRGYILTNPADGIKFKPENFEKEFYPPETLKKLLRFVAEKHKELVGYYVLLAFAGLRPSEGARVQWHHITFSTRNLHIIKGKTDARDIILEPLAMEWIKWHRDNSPSDAPFIPQNNLFNLEREVREGFRALNNDKWIADGLRHGFATYFSAFKQDNHAVAWYMGNSVAMIKKHYAKSIPQAELDAFWGLTPSIVMAVDSKK